VLGAGAGDAGVDARRAPSQPVATSPNGARTAGDLDAEPVRRA
jgi:hypothetical protein